MYRWRDEEEKERAEEWSRHWHGDAFFIQILLASFGLNIAYTQHATTLCLHFCPSLSVFPSFRPPLPHLLHLRLCRLLISNSAWSAGCRQTGVEREDAVFVCRCLPLLPSKWKRPVGSSVCVYLSLSEGSNKAWKCCPQAVCVFGWRSGSDRRRRSNIVYDSLPRRFILGKLKMCCGLAFDLDSASMSSWICVWQRQTWRQTDGDNKPGTERQATEGRRGGETGSKRELEKKGGRCISVQEERGVWRHWGLFLKSAFFILYLSFGTSYAMHIASNSSVNAMNPPEQSYCRSQTRQRLLSLLACRFSTQSHLISLTQLPMNALLVATSSSIKFKLML